MAIESCLAQTYPSYEIVIGDDSRADDSQMMVAEFQAQHPDKIHYLKNTPSLGQAENINALFRCAAGARLVLLHDDDLLLPNALRDLSDCWVGRPSLAAAFGKQYMMTMGGDILSEESENLNESYGRTADRSGMVIPGLAGIRQMFPNDGFMVLAEKARATGYRPFSVVGAACDFDFGLRYCLDNDDVWFCDNYTTVYRLSDDAISKTSITAPYVYKLLNEYEERKKNVLAPEVRSALRDAIESSAPRAVSGYARLGQGFDALRILASSDYAFPERFRLKFLLHSALTFAALIGGAQGARLVVRAMARIGRQAKQREIVG